MVRSMKSVVRRRQLLESQWSIKLNLLITLVRRDLEARYKGSILGNLWPLLNQLVQLLIFTYVFSIVLQVKLNIQGVPADNKLAFGLWLFAGLLPWLAFTNGLTQATTSVVGQPNLVKKVVFPLGLLPLVPVCSAFIESSFGLVALVGLTLVIVPEPTIGLWLLPVVWIPQLLLTAGLGYFSAGLTVFLRDIPQSLGVILNLWFYATPIVYPASKIPEAWRVWVFWLNPITAIAETYRDIVLKGQIEHWGELAMASIVSIIIFYGGVWVYKRLRPAFADVL